MGIAAVEQNIKYKSELEAGSTVTIRSGVLDIREKVVRFIHEMRNDSTGEVAASMVLTASILTPAKENQLSLSRRHS